MLNNFCIRTPIPIKMIGLMILYMYVFFPTQNVDYFGNSSTSYCRIRCLVIWYVGRMRKNLFSELTILLVLQTCGDSKRIGPT